MRVAPVRIYGTSRLTYIDTYACLDTAAGDCICSQEILDLLNLKGEARPTAVMAATGTVEATTASYLTLDIRGYRTTEIFSIEVIGLSRITDLAEHIPTQGDIDRHPHMRGLSIPQHARKSVDLIICVGESRLHHVYESRVAASEQLWASCTGLGWVIHGRDSRSTVEREDTVHVNAVQVPQAGQYRSPPEGEGEILEKVRRTFALDFCEPQHDQRTLMSRTDRKMLQRQQETFRIEDGRCVVGKLWKKSPHVIPNNRQLAEQCLRRLGQRLLKDPVLLGKYKTFIDGLVANRQAEIALVLLGGKPGYFLPHHPVLEKFRVVFNGAARYLGQCLNDYLDKGPEHTSSLIGVFLRFREGRYAVSADIKGMFYNISLPEEDRDYMRFLWFEDGDPTKQVVEYRLTHQVPGLTDSPSNACYALGRLATDNPAQVSADTCKVMLDSFYVDDLCFSGSDYGPTQKVVSEITSALAPGGLHITKFISNHPDLLSSVKPEDIRPRDRPVEEGDPARDKVLGTYWDTELDELVIQFDKPSQKATRRGILSYVMSPFDPTGITLPFLLDMKLLVQHLFASKWDWDEPLVGKELESWSNWVAELPCLRPIRCKRALIPRPGYQSIRLCVFTDASEKGYAAVAYVVCEYDDETTVAFAFGKVRVAPKKKLITIPRLELMAAVIGVELASAVKEELRATFTSVQFWTDSTTVLHWVTNPDLQLKAFVANRVAKVVERSQDATWAYVNTRQNPADVGSRGLRPGDNDGIRLWLDGPSWLSQGVESWPCETIPAPPDEKQLEVKKVNCLLVKQAVAVTRPLVSPLQRLFERYETLQELTQAVAWLLRLRNLLRKKPVADLTSKKEMTAAETGDALLELVRAAQWDRFPVLMHVLTASPPVQDSEVLAVANKQRRNLRILCPFVDEYGLLRVGGRVQRAGFSYAKTHPLILPSRHPLTGYVIRECHINSLHSGQNYVLAQLRKKYWVLNGPSAVQHYIRDCRKCKRIRAGVGAQQMAPLPEVRFAVGLPPFTYAAVDYFGPVKVKLTRRVTAKRWGCLITCLTTRAVHLEVAHELSANSFLMAFRRFLSRFPTVREMWSDNGSNFVKADKDLKQEFEENINFEEIAQGLRKDDSVDFRWKFNPPSASHHGGVFERLIGLVKKCLTFSMDDISYRTPTDEGLLTILKEIEGILNARPLLPASRDPTSFDVLTPNQLLQPGLPSVPPTLREFTSGDSLRPGYRASQWAVDLFWRRFSSEYIPMLQKRDKWLHPKRNFQINDLVLIKDKDAKRYKWRLGLVSEVHPSKKDGLVRTVTVKQAYGKPLIRDIRSLCFLEAFPELWEKELKLG